MIKMYCIFSQEAIDKMQGNRGKLAAQAGHAYLHAFWDADDYFEEVCRQYKRGMDARKICLVVKTTAELRDLQEKYHPITGTSLVKDCGYTIFEEPTITCLGIGPLRDEDKCELLKSLPLLR